MPYIGEANIDESWKNVVTEFVPNLAEGTRYRILHLSLRGGEYIRQAANPGNALKGHGVPLSGMRKRQRNVSSCNPTACRGRRIVLQCG